MHTAEMIQKAYDDATRRTLEIWKSGILNRKPALSAQNLSTIPPVWRSPAETAPGRPWQG
ncbi:hypothetical protein [Rahnella selenatireducens]|uniref:hypothetical protein n=1 Tax=Rahnella selenatireducens TaxID=3389797 RepID=UPI0039690E20